jgi:hypothetical protein
LDAAIHRIEFDTPADKENGARPHFEPDPNFDTNQTGAARPSRPNFDYRA